MERRINLYHFSAYLQRLRWLVVLFAGFFSHSHIHAQPIVLTHEASFQADTAFDLYTVAQTWIPDTSRWHRYPWEMNETEFSQPDDWQVLLDGMERPPVLWVKFEVDARSWPYPQDWLLAWDAYESSIFWKTHEGWDSARSGNFVPARERSYGVAFGAIPYLPVRISSEKQTFYVRIHPGQVRGHERLVWPHAKLMTPLLYLQYDRRARSFDSLLFGIILAIALYNLVLYFSTRSQLDQREYLYFGLFGIALMLFLLNLKDYTLSGIWPNWPVWNYVGFSMLMGFLTFFSFTRFSRNFLKIHVHSPRRMLLVNILVGINAAIILYRFGLEIWAPEYHAWNHPWLARYTRLGWVAITITTFWAGLGSYAYLPRLTRRYIITNSLLLVTAFLRLLYTSDLFPIMIPFEFIALVVTVQQILFALTLTANILLLQREKRQAEDEALERKIIDDTKSRFFTQLTHEFRTPLTVIGGLATQLLSDTRTQQELRLAVIRRNIQRLLSLINQLLELARLGNSVMELKPYRQNILPFLSSIADAHQSAALVKEIKLQRVFPLESLEMDFDPEALQKVLDNLISNAIKYTPEGGTITLLSTANEADKVLEIAVMDTGIGIAPEHLPHLFDQFYRISDAPNPASSGIGLAIVKEWVHLMGGTVDVESTIGKGSRFTVRLPITKKAKIGAEATVVTSLLHDSMVFPISEPVKADPLTREEGLVVLIVEDNQDVRFVLRQQLQEYYQVHEAENGHRGLEIAQAKLPDLIISDVVMPKMDGISMLEQLRADVRTDHIPVLILTASTQPDIRIKGWRKGADAFLTKPYDQGELLIQIQNILMRRAAWQRRLQTQELDPLEHEASPDLDFIQKVKGLVKQNLSDDSFNVARLSEALFMSRTQLYRKLKQVAEITPKDLIRNLRMEEARRLLLQTELNVSEIAYRVGFPDHASFSRNYRQLFDETPTETRKKGK